MEIKDKEVLELLEKYPSREIEYRIESYEPSEVFEETELELLMNTASDVYEFIHSPSSLLGKIYAKSLEIYRKTKGFACMPLNPYSLEPIYTEVEVQEAKELIDEANFIRQIIHDSFELKKKRDKR